MTVLASAPTLGQAPFWYLTRSTGVVAFVLLTLTMAFGVAATHRAVAAPRWPRFATQHLHRNLSLLGVAFLVVHVVTTVVDGYAPIGWWAAVVPLASRYRTLGVSLGTLASDLMLVLLVTSAWRTRLPQRLWRVVHLAAYGLWPLAWVHFLTTGTDAGWSGVGLWIAVVSLLVVVAASAVRWVTREGARGPVASLR